MIPIPDVRALMQKYQVRAKKSWGQNFLVSEEVYHSIVSASVLSPSSWIAEIGAGLGTLTARLARQLPQGKVFAIERDRDLLAILRNQFEDLSTIEIVAADAMKYDFCGLAAGHHQPLTLCGNLPYQLSGRLLFHTVEIRRCISQAIFMVQREVAQRLVATVGTKAYGALTAILRPFAQIELLSQVPPSAFIPPPKVHSTVVRLVFYAESEMPIDVQNVSHYIAVVKAAFAQRRKTLRNALSAQFAANEIASAAEQTGLDLTRRGETLEIEEFAKLAAALPLIAGKGSVHA